MCDVNGFFCFTDFLLYTRLRFELIRCSLWSLWLSEKCLNRFLLCNWRKETTGRLDWFACRSFTFRFIGLHQSDYGSYCKEHKASSTGGKMQKMSRLSDTGMKTFRSCRAWNGSRANIEMLFRANLGFLSKTGHLPVELFWGQAMQCFLRRMHWVLLARRLLLVLVIGAQFLFSIVCQLRKAWRWTALHTVRLWPPPLGTTPIAVFSIVKYSIVFRFEEDWIDLISEVNKRWRWHKEGSCSFSVRLGCAGCQNEFF